MCHIKKKSFIQKNVFEQTKQNKNELKYLKIWFPVDYFIILFIKVDFLILFSEFFRAPNWWWERVDVCKCSLICTPKFFAVAIQENNGALSFDLDYIDYKWL